jgi:hypothetical protein
VISRLKPVRFDGDNSPSIAGVERRSQIFLTDGAIAPPVRLTVVTAVTSAIRLFVIDAITPGIRLPVINAIGISPAIATRLIIMIPVCH